ncbi:MAG: penicillin-binding protein 1A [Desulfosalsimonadaceae bacterium]
MVKNYIIRLESVKEKNAGNGVSMKTGKVLTISAIVFIAAVSGGITGAVIGLTQDLPQIRMLESYSPSAVSRIYSSDNVLLAELHVEKRDPIPLDDMPDTLQTALLTTEDRQFYQHSGIDLKGIARAIINNIRSGGYVEGASTLTQQLAKTLFLTPEKSLQRKLREAFLAFQLERRYTKNEILERYLNQVYFGSGAYGVEMAAKRYFGKSAADLDLSESALLAAMPKAPSVYSPLVNPELAVKRRNLVLAQMRETGAINMDAYEKAIKTPYTSPSRTSNARKAPYFVDFIIREMEAAVGSSALYKGGLTIHTTLSYRMQEAAERALETGLDSLANRMGANGEPDPVPQGALVAIDVQTGGILAMTGGRDYHESPFNRATDARRQPGSAFKPILYAYAIEQGFSQASLLLDAPVDYNGWQPRNFSETYEGEITLRKSLADSKNIPAARLLQQVGPSAVIDFAGACGITSPMAPYPSLALGAFEMTLLELTSAYTVFPNGGTHAEPHGAIMAATPDGRTVWKNPGEKKFVMSRAGAAVITDVLRGVVTEGTGRKASDIGRAVAGKTGTTSSYRDALFIGFSPDIAAGVWTGRDDFTSLGPYETGGRAALPIWKQFMAEALKDQPITFFDFPDDVVEIRMDPATGKRVHGSSGVAARFRKSEVPE